jgi:hypothetical protein
MLRKTCLSLAVSRGGRPKVWSRSELVGRRWSAAADPTLPNGDDRLTSHEASYGDRRKKRGLLAGTLPDKSVSSNPHSP